MNQNSFSSKAWLNIGVFTTLLLGSVWWLQSPLTSSRPRDPQTSRLIDASFPTEKPFARQWQDPFEPYYEHLKMRGLGEKGADRAKYDAQQEKFERELRKRFIDDFTKHIKKDCKFPNDEFLLMGIMVPGGPFEDRTERRQRIRVALASAMAVGGYAPDDSEHLGLFPVGFDSADSDKQYMVPYEWFAKIKGNDRRYNSFPSRYKRILVFWISDDNFAETPLQFLHELRGQVQWLLKIQSPKYDLANTDFAVFGPWSSTTLQKLLNEVGRNDFTKDIQKSKFAFYNVFATVPLPMLENPWGNSKLDEDVIKEKLHNVLGGSKDSVFRYTTCPDRKLAAAMKGELARRGVNFEKDQIAFIAEHDTVYGRSLPKTFRSKFIGYGEAPNIVRFTYLRGLDGRLAQEIPKSDSNAPSANPRMSIESRFVPTRKTNRPEGNNQFDYIIRLGEEMRQMEREKGEPFKVIGLLGSDVYDKLLLLQALRPLFPNALFFTTDLDAAYTHPQELEWTKNLLVASTHGLTLDDYYQCGTLPFRFSYQTAAFQAILGATTYPKENGQNENAAPITEATRHQKLLQHSPACIFEIGWDKAYDLSPAPESIHPPRTEIHKNTWQRYCYHAVAVLCLACISLFVLGFFRHWSRFALPLVMLLVGVVIGCIIWWDACSPDGEPWVWGGGISTWPSTVIRLIVCLVSVTLVWYAYNRGQKAVRELDRQFGVHEFKVKIFSKEGILLMEAQFITMFIKLFFTQHNDDMKSIADLWKEHDDERPGCFLFDVFIFVLASAAIYFPLFQWMDNWHFPYRGSWCYGWGVVIWVLAWITTLVLTLMTFFITHGCCRFIKAMDRSIKWDRLDSPKPSDSAVTLRKFAKRWGKGEWQHIAPLVDVVFVETWTKNISNIVLYPVVSIALLFVAESAYFDNYGYNPYRYVVLGFMALLIFAPAFQLRRDARKLQAKKIKEAREKLEYHPVDDEVTRKKIEFAIKETENLREGAFEPFWEHPFIQAILVLLGGISVPSFLSMMNRPF